MNALSNTAILSTSKTCSELSDISFITISEFSKIVRQSEKKQLSRNHVCCRICLQSSDSEELLSPCYCSGTIGIIHKHCLERWLNLSRSRTCEICGYKFKVLRRYPVFSEWLWSGGEGDGIHRRKHLWTDIICLLLMLPLLTLCTWLTISSSQEEIGINRRGFPWQSFSLGLLCSLLLLVFIIWLTFSVRYHHQSWRIWRIDQSCIVLAEDINKAKILDEKYDIEYQNVVVQSDIQEQITMPRSNEADLEHDQIKVDITKLSSNAILQHSGNAENYCLPQYSLQLEGFDHVNVCVEDDVTKTNNKIEIISTEEELNIEYEGDQLVISEIEPTQLLNSSSVSIVSPVILQSSMINKAIS